MEFEIISRECIKPYSPTPPHLRNYRLCFLDQSSHHFYVPIVLYYPVNIQHIASSTHVDEIISTRLQLLKHSLSATLSPFYPFAGRINGNHSIDCNDEGIYFVEARAKSPLNEFLKQPNYSLINKFIPLDASKQGGPISELYVAKIQVTAFACGGLAICTCISHQFGDGTTLSLFFNSWAAMACKNTDEAAYPNNDASSLFPQNDSLTTESNSLPSSPPFLKCGRFATRRFVFEANAIATLKAKAISSCVQNPSRVEVVSSFISKCIVKAFKTKSGSHKPILLTHLVDFRQKAKPPLSKSSTGNLMWVANALCTNEQEELDSMVCKLRKAIMKVDSNFVQSLQGPGGFLNFCNAMKDQNRASTFAVDKITFTSLCRTGFDNTDFGWGKPIWISCFTLDGLVTNFLNTVILTDTRFRDEIEAWVFLLEEDMKILEHDKELLAFSTVNPSPLQFGTRISTSRL